MAAWPDPRRRGVKPGNAGRRFPPEPLTREEVTRLLAACSPRAKTGVRNRALIAVLWRGGLRVNEALALFPKDVDRDAGTLRVLHGKGDRWRLVGLDPGAMALVVRWLELRRRLGVGSRRPLFCRLRKPHVGAPLTDARVRELLKLRAEKAGIEKRVHPHGLRHTHAFELANENTPVHLIQAQLGHASLAQTERYIRHLAPTAVVAAMQARSWSENGNGAEADHGSNGSPVSRSTSAP